MVTDRVLPESNKVLVRVLPWLALRQQVSVGNHSFWPFYKYSETLITDSSLRDHLKRLLAAFVRPVLGEGRRYATPIPELTVLGAVNKAEDQSTGSEFVDARNALAFACIDGNRNGNCVTNEGFSVYTLNFVPGSMEIAYPRGKICKFGAEPLGVGIDELLIQMPDEVDPGYEPNYDQELLAALSVAVANQQPTNSLVIRRSLDYFLQAYTNDPAMRHEVRIMLMFIAFEILLSTRGKRDFILNKIGPLCNCAEDSTKQHAIRSPKSQKSRSQMLTTKQVWAEDFYFLRDKIVHGLPVDDQDFLFNGKPHFSISVDFYRLCVRKKLEGLEGASYNCSARIDALPNGQFQFANGQSDSTL